MLQAKIRHFAESIRAVRLLCQGAFSAYALANLRDLPERLADRFRLDTCIAQNRVESILYGALAL